MPEARALARRALPSAFDRGRETRYDSFCADLSFSLRARNKYR
jgi:hypothetical protein